jgi:hypothetical protein
MLRLAPVARNRGQNEPMRGNKSWDRFQEDMGSLGERLREAYRAAPTDSARAELRAALDRFQEGAETAVRALDRVVQDPQVRAGTERAARSFGTALAETFRMVGDEVAGAVRSAKGKRPKP